MSFKCIPRRTEHYKLGKSTIRSPNQFPSEIIDTLENHLAQ